MFSRFRFALEVAAVVACGAIVVATLVQPRWFELLFDEAPDGGDGSLEGLVAIVSSLIAMSVFGLMAVREWRLRPLGDGHANP